MNKLFIYTTLIVLIVLNYSCKTTKNNINKIITKKDTIINVVQSINESVKEVESIVKKFNAHYIDFKTFNSKIKVDYEDSKGKQPDITANVRIIKDSAIWISLSATFLNVEVFRIYVNKDSIILLNKQQKEVQYRSLDYLQEVTEIPFDYKTLQDLLIGNPIFLDSTIVALKKTNEATLLSSLGNYFKHLVSLSNNDYLLMHSKLDDIDISRSRTAALTYSGYENKDGINFSTHREIAVSEKNKLDIQLNYKSYDFNKELSVPFNVPKNYKRK